MENIGKIRPESAYYIKLGSGGEYEQDCIETSQTIRVGFNDIRHELCIERRWDRVRSVIEERHKNYNPGTATVMRNQLRIFYEAPENALWITFYKTRLYWCFAGKNVTPLPDGSRTRPALGGWKPADIFGESLDMSRLSGSLLSVQGYRSTLCEVKEFPYLVRKINGESSPAEQTAFDAREALVNSLVAIIRSLDWKEFELLVDLIFRQAGWQRIGQLGKTQKTLDLDLFSPIANERYIVQVKSQASEHAFKDMQEKTAGMQSYTRCYLVVHTPGIGLTKDLETETEKIWFPENIAGLVVQYGLVDWVITKAK